MKKMKNSVEKGKVRYIIFKESNSWYGVALEFNLVVEGDDKATTFFNLSEAIQGYVEATRRSRIRPTVLNQAPSKEYTQLWKAINSGRETKLKRYGNNQNSTQTEKPVTVYNYGFIPQLA